MNTISLLRSGTVSIHASVAWYLSDLGEFRGNQERYTRQSPQRLREEMEQACSGVSPEMVRRVLREQQVVEVIEREVRGPKALAEKR